MKAAKREGASSEQIMEAMNAALLISGENGDEFQATLDEMGNSAGATNLAFETMAGGLDFNIERLKAFGATVMLDVGEALSPVIGQ